MSEAMRQALEFAAQHLNSSWPEHCQETVRRARAALAPTATTPPTPAATLPDWVRAYGEERARAALEEAARVCDVTPPYPFRPSIEAAHAIRQLIIRPAD